MRKIPPLTLTFPAQKPPVSNQANSPLEFVLHFILSAAFPHLLAKFHTQISHLCAASVCSFWHRKTWVASPKPQQKRRRREKYVDKPVRHDTDARTRQGGFIRLYFIAVWDCGWKEIHQKKGAKKNVYPLDKKSGALLSFPSFKNLTACMHYWGLSSPSSRVLSHAVRCSPAVKTHPSCAHEHATGRRRSPTSTDN